MVDKTVVKQDENSVSYGIFIIATGCSMLEIMHNYSGLDAAYLSAKHKTPLKAQWL